MRRKVKRKRKSRPQSARASKRKAARQVTETIDPSANAKNADSELVTETISMQPGGSVGNSQPTPQIRSPKTALGKLRAALNGLDQLHMNGVVASVTADATTAEKASDRTAAANAIVRLAKLCEECDNESDPDNTPQTGRIHVHGDVNVAADGVGADFIELAREFGCESEFLAQIAGSPPAGTVDAEDVRRSPSSVERDEPGEEERGQCEAP